MATNEEELYLIGLKNVFRTERGRLEKVLEFAKTYDNNPKTVKIDSTDFKRYDIGDSVYVYYRKFLNGHEGVAVMFHDLDLDSDSDSVSDSVCDSNSISFNSSVNIGCLYGEGKNINGISYLAGRSVHWSIIQRGEKMDFYSGNFRSHLDESSITSHITQIQNRSNPRNNNIDKLIQLSNWIDDIINRYITKGSNPSNEIKSSESLGGEALETTVVDDVVVAGGQLERGSGELIRTQ